MSDDTLTKRTGIEQRTIKSTDLFRVHTAGILGGLLLRWGSGGGGAPQGLLTPSPEVPLGQPHGGHQTLLGEGGEVHGAPGAARPLRLLRARHQLLDHDGRWGPGARGAVGGAGGNGLVEEQLW